MGFFYFIAGTIFLSPSIVVFFSSNQTKEFYASSGKFKAG